LNELRLVNRIVSVDKNGKLERQDDAVDLVLVERTEQGLHLVGLRSVG